MVLRGARTILAAILLAVAAGCSSGGSIGSSATTAPGSTCTTVTGGKVTIVTRDFDYSPDCLRLAGSTLSVTYENAEKGVSHNFHLLGATSASGDSATNLRAGPHTETITYVHLEPGTYTWVCDLHPIMKGTLVVTSAGADPSTTS
jgi:plastocyanin